MAKPKENADQPWLENYPPLKEWIDKHGHSCMWDAKTSGDCRVEAWLVQPELSLVILTIRPFRRGWDLFTSCQSNNIAETIRDANVRCGIVKPPAPPTFAEAWREMEAKGYQYGSDALENVRFGFAIARGEKP